MKILKRLGLVAAAVVVLVVVAGAYIWLTSRPIPNLGRPAPGSEVLHDENYREAADKAREALMPIRERLSAPAVAAGVGAGGRLVWSAVQGFASLDPQVTAGPESVFPIGSASKPLTAALVVQLAERGLIDLDADVRSYVPAFPPKAHVVTLRQLLSHQAGIRHYRFSLRPPAFSEAALNRHFDSVSASLQLFADDPLAFEPDHGFQYSTYGYTLVSAAVEGATGGDFISYIASALFEPLGMNHTGPDRDRGDGQTVARYLVLGSRRVVPAPATDSSNKWAGGGFLSTPDDLVRFGTALLRGDIVSRESAEMMFEPRQLIDGSINPQNYGLGWRTTEAAFPAGSERTTRILLHGGTAIGSQSMLVLVPERELVVALCTNSFIGGSGPLAQAAVDLARLFAPE